MREQVLQYVDQYKIIAIVRGADPKQCFAVAEALYAGGIRLMEVTYDQKKPETWQRSFPTGMKGISCSFHLYFFIQ